MRAYGSDRLRLAGEQVILWTRRPKPHWTPRVPKTLTKAEHPGTAILWDEQFYEVVYAMPLPTGAVEYTLEPWRETHAIRLSDRYDDESEQQRTVSHHAEVRRSRNRTATLLLGMFAGHLPRPVQNQLGNELGVNPATLTLMSLIPEWAAFAVMMLIAASARMEERPDGIPLIVSILVGLGFLDAGIRGFVYGTQSRAMGSPFGFVAYFVYYYVFARDRSRLPSPLEEEKGWRSPISAAPDDVALRDSLTMWGPLISLLSVPEQKKLEAIGFDYRQHAFGVAWIILVGSAIGAVVSFLKLRDFRTLSSFVSMMVAAALAFEQVLRLSAFSKGPAGSVLGVLARPFLRKLLERA